MVNKLLVNSTQDATTSGGFLTPVVVAALPMVYQCL